VTRDTAKPALDAAIRAARECGVDPTDAAVLRVASAVTIELPRAAAIARVETPLGRSAAHRQVIAARILEERQVPAARLLAPERQPVELEGGVVTLWRRLEVLPGSPDPEAVGRITRQMHSACAADLPAETPDLDPFEPLSGWLERLGEPPRARELEESLEELRRLWPQAAKEDPLGATLVHGDLNADNVVLTDQGPVLVDLEMAGRGPASWDLLGPWLAVRRYGADDEVYRRFCAGYGAELPATPAVALLQRTYELHLVCWAVGHRDLSPVMAEQAELRLATFLGESDRPWTLL
jgi:hypothetical protein